MPDAPTVTTMVTDTTISQIAREVARDIIPLDAVLKKFKLDTQTYDKIFDLPYFQRRLEEELAVWNGSDSSSIRTRIAAKAASVIEESLLEVFDLVHDKSQPLSGKVEALKFAARLASMGDGAVDAGGPDGDKVIINIAFSGNQVTFEKQRSSAPVLDVIPETDHEPPT